VYKVYIKYKNGVNTDPKTYHIMLSSANKLTFIMCALRSEIFKRLVH